MKVAGWDSICLWSEDPDRLAKFYEEVIGLEVGGRMDLENDRGVLFKVGESWLFVGYHDKVHGSSKDPYRIMPGFMVESVKAVFSEIAPKGVEFIQEPTISPDGKFYVATIKDPEGNILQFFSDNP